LSQTRKPLCESYYVAYGSNLNVQEMLRRCPDAVLIARETLCGYKLAFKGKGKGYLTIEPACGHSVPVALWKISEKDLKALDVYEDAGNLYDTMRFMLHHKPCFTYIMKPHFPICRPSAEYTRQVLQGYKDMEFSSRELEDLIAKISAKNAPDVRLAAV
jgi:gamma-glutamylcyclotransferase (GGCT)/AIG2-like uncharacterized protein YtfP